MEDFGLTNIIQLTMENRVIQLITKRRPEKVPAGAQAENLVKVVLEFLESDGRKEKNLQNYYDILKYKNMH